MALNVRSACMIQSMDCACSQGTSAWANSHQASEHSRLLQARRKSRAAAIQDASHEPRPQPEETQREALVGDPLELLSPLRDLPLSPLSSMGLDLSAEPLSPTTTAALQIMRERGFPQSASAGFMAIDAGLEHEVDRRATPVIQRQTWHTHNSKAPLRRNCCDDL